MYVCICICMYIYMYIYICIYIYTPALSHRHPKSFPPLSLARWLVQGRDLQIHPTQAFRVDVPVLLATWVSQWDVGRL